MVVIMKPGTEQADIRKLVAKFEAMNLKVGVTKGVGCTILGLVGDTVALDEDEIMLNEMCIRDRYGAFQRQWLQEMENPEPEDGPAEPHTKDLTLRKLTLTVSCLLYTSGYLRLRPY